MASFASMLRNVLIVLASALAIPMALAHVHLTKQDPTTNAEVATSSQALMLNFSEDVEPRFSGVALTGPNKEQIKTGKAPRSEQDKTQLIALLD